MSAHGASEWRANDDIIPTNVGLDGAVGGGADGKWYGGVYGWGFTVVVPQTGALAHRDTFHLGVEGFLNATLLTGDHRWMDPWRRQIDKVNSNHIVRDGRRLYPHKYGDNGWYHFQQKPYAAGAREIYYVTLRDEDLERVGVKHPWFEYLQGRNSSYPEQVLRGDLEKVRTCVQGMRADSTTPDTRLADDPIKYNPASVRSLSELMMGGLHPGKNGLIFHCRLRYFDPEHRRAGMPKSVAALVESMTDDRTVVHLINTSQVHERTVVVQGGAYAEHQILAVSQDTGKTESQVNNSRLTVHLAPGAGARLHLRMRRYANQPTMAFPWNRP